MKKNITKKRFSLILLTILTSVFLSCGFDEDEGIFKSIRNEVALDEAKIYGTINSIVRYQLDGVENIFVENGKIYNRVASIDKDTDGNDVSTFEESAAYQKLDWNTFTKPSGKVYALGSDSTYLYALSIVFEDDDDGYNTATTRSLFCYDGSSWTEIWSTSYSSSYEAYLFCTNAPKNENREAYFRYGTAVWQLNGTTSLSDDNAMTTGDTDNSTSPTTGVNSCTKLGSTTYFSSSEAMISNETSSSDATFIYYASGDCVYYTPDGSTWTAVDLDCDTIVSLAVTSDYLLAGTDGGIVHTTWSSEGIPASGNASFSTNASSTLSSYYEILQVLAVDPSLSETAGTLFASTDTSSSSASLKNVGLWGYFASKGKWNRE
ncbi:MAG: hypothetical protein II821_01645 [Treponema sp.]|nr:hypothetical protein [Treponema sp.]